MNISTINFTTALGDFVITIDAVGDFGPYQVTVPVFSRGQWVGEETFPLTDLAEAYAKIGKFIQNAWIYAQTAK